MNGYMLDTSFFNRVLTGQVSFALFARHRVFATHVQLDELQRTNDHAKRVQLIAAFETINPTMVPTASAVWDDSKWDESCWSAEEGGYEGMLARLQELDLRSKARGFNQSRDVLIAETAIRGNLTLVTEDANLTMVIREFGGRAIDSKTFEEEASAV